MSDHSQTRTTRPQTARQTIVPGHVFHQVTIAGAQPANAAVQRAQIDPERLTAADVIALQGTVGNAAVQRLLTGPRTARRRPAPFVPVAAPRLHTAPAIQTALTVGPADDRYEEEAERISRQVTRRGALGVQRATQSATAAPQVGAEGGAVDRATETHIRHSSGGSSLPNGMRRVLEPKLNADLSQVKVHTDSRAMQLNRQLGAKAFTHKNHIYYGAGQSPSDLQLTAHETVHTIQQGVTPVRRSIQPRLAQGQAGSKAVHGATIRPILQRTAKHGDLELIQLSRLGTFVKQQEKLQTAAKRNPDQYRDYTTTGFEHEFAQMVDDDPKNPAPLTGVSHAEVAHSQNKMPYTGMSFILETDASNAMEMVSPPFLVKTIPGKPVPEPDEVEDIDEIFKERLGELAARNLTVGGLIAALKSDGIRFTLKKIKIGSENMTPKTTKLRSWWNNRIKKNELANIKLKPISKSSGATEAGILTHVNFATDFENYRLMENAYTGTTDDWRQSYEQIETWLLQEINKVCMAEDPAPELDGTTLLAIENAISAAQTVKRKVDAALNKADSQSLLRSVMENYVMPTHIKRPGAVLDAIIGELSAKRLNSQRLMIMHEAYRAPGALTADVTAIIRSGEQYRLDEFNDRIDALSNEEVQAKLNDVTLAMNTLVQALDGLPISGATSKLQQFLHALARTLSSQVAVPALETLRNAQSSRYKSKNSTAMEDLTYEPYITSRLKDVREVWIKDTIQNIGLGMLSTKDWEKVRALTKDEGLRKRIKSSLPAFKYESTKHKTTRLVNRSRYADHVINALDDLGNQIQSHKLGQTNKHGRPKVDTSRKFIGPKKQTTLFSHVRKWIGARQDTFIPAHKVQMPQWKDRRLHVVESRNYTVDTLKRIKAYHAGMRRKHAPKFAPPPVPRDREPSRSQSASYSDTLPPRYGRSRSVSLVDPRESFIPSPPSEKVAKLGSKLGRIAGPEKLQAINNFINQVMIHRVPWQRLSSLVTDRICLGLKIEGATYDLALDYIFSELQHRGYSFLD